MEFSEWKQNYLEQDFKNQTMNQYSMALAAWDYQRKEAEEWMDLAQKYHLQQKEAEKKIVELEKTIFEGQEK